jgi:hypothetical protein
MFDLIRVPHYTPFPHEKNERFGTSDFCTIPSRFGRSHVAIARLDIPAAKVQDDRDIGVISAGG